MKTCPLVVFLISFTVTSWAGINVKDFNQAIPKTVGEWEVRDHDEFYNRKTLYEYINGGAELYLTYDFKQVFVRRYLGPGNNEIVLDIYDMGLSSDAFGIFSVEREDEAIGIGQGSEYGGGLLRFWKGRFFVSILTTGDEQTAKPVMIKLAQNVDHVIDAKGPKPALLQVLPGEGLDEKRIKFFHTAAILNRQYFLAEKNILKLNQHTNCVLANYKIKDNSAVVLLVEYQNDELAKDANGTFFKFYMPEAKESGLALLENKTWAMIKRDGNILILVLEATRQDFGMNLMAKIKLKER
jgi:hypothetical protein